MRNPPLVSVRILVTAGLLVLWALNSISSVQAEESETGPVPEPWVHETHVYNVSGDIDGKPTNEFFVNERWSIEVRHGDVMTLIMARNITQNNIASVDYTNNIHYSIGGKLYIAQFMMIGLTLKVGSYDVTAPLSTCSDFELEYSPLVYDGTVPTFDCNITYKDIRLYFGASAPAGSVGSTVDLTLVHHIRGDWTNTRIKVEALLEFQNTVLFNPNDGNNEFGIGASFTAELSYGMMLANPEDARISGPVVPTSCTNSTLEYNMTLDSGAPLTMSKLEMKDSFTTYNSTGSQTSIGYSSMVIHGAQASVTHGFPNMTYGETQSMKSDPEISVYHDRVTANDNPGNPNQTPKWGLIAVVGVAGAAAVIGAVLFLRKRKNR